MNHPVSNIFRAYDIRGKYGPELNAETAYGIGKAFAAYISGKYDKQRPQIIVGRDNRTHGPELQRALIEGLQEQGADVIEVTDCPSPMLYFTVCDRKLDAGVNVTASHNPAEYNGFKLVGREAHSIAGEEIQVIRRMVEEAGVDVVRRGSLQTVSELYDPRERYEKCLSERIRIERRLKIVIDAGNGIAGKYYPELFRKLGCEVIELHCEQDGTFPNHEPDPVVEANTSDLKKKVVETASDVGLAFDGDGDRFAVVDEKGVYHDANQTFVLLIRDALSRHPGAAVVYTVSNSLIIPEETRRLGGKPVMVAVGHSQVELAMRTHVALLAGEQSGHFFLSEGYFGFDDAAYASGRLLQIFSAARDSVSTLYASIPKTFSKPEFRPHCADDKKFEVIEKISSKLRQKYDCDTRDGVRVELNDGSWVTIRVSNTSPCLSVCMEAKSETGLEKIHQLAIEVLAEHGITI